MKLSAPVFRLKRRARLLSRTEKIPLNAALDRVAAEEGFSSWSLLAARLPTLATAATPSADDAARDLFAALVPGDLVLVGARPGQGKTLMSLRLAVEAMKRGSRSVFFTLEYTPDDVFDRLRAIGAKTMPSGDLFEIDSSDAVSAGHIMKKLASAAPRTLAVIDYLQLLDQKRENPTLMLQVRALKAFARDRGLILVFISQIDRSYDASAKPCPDMDDIRLPNPLDLSLFDRMCFLNGGEMRLPAAR